MKKLLFVLLGLTTPALAQPEAVKKIALQTSTESLKKNLYYLASDKMEGRIMASHGDTLASIFVANWFKTNKLAAPYDNGKNYFQAITSYKVTTVDKLTIDGKEYAKSGNWLSSRDFSSIENAAVIVPFFSNPDSLLIALSKVDCKGKAIVIPASLGEKIGTDEKLEQYLKKLADQGIVAAVSSSALIQRMILNAKEHAFLPQYADSTTAFSKTSKSLPTLSLTQERINELLVSDQLTIKGIEGSIGKNTRQEVIELKTRLSADVKKTFQKTQAPNVIGVISGTDASADCIVISAHHDHDGRNGNVIYYGAVDNASGTVAIMEMAAMMNKAIQKGFRPKRTIVFASFTGEERGLLGSYYYVDHPVIPITKTRAIMNIDMMGRVDTIYSGKKADSTYAYILVKDSLNIGLRNSLLKANETINLKLDTRYENPQYAQRRIRGSDQFPFYKRGIPFLRIDCGFAKEYHMPNDTPDKINYPLLTKQTQLAFLTLWNIAND